MYSKHTKKKVIFIYIALLSAFALGCNNSEIHMDSFTQGKAEKIVENNNEIYDEIISQVNMDPYDEIGWMTSEPTGGVIVYNGHIYKDVDGDGVDELFILRAYVNSEKAFDVYKNYKYSLYDYNKFAIRRGFISEAYKIVNGKVEELKINNEPVATHAFDGAHFGSFYYFLEDGRLANYGESYSDQTMLIYDNLKLSTTVSYVRDLNTSEWYWEVNGRKTDRSSAMKKIVN